MTQRWLRETDRLKQSIIDLAKDVESRVNSAVESTLTSDQNLAATIISSDSEIDKKEVELEEECLKILALHQPVASDLRFVVAVLKINNDLERIADLAKNIAARTIYISKISVHQDFPQIAEMAEIAKKMLRLGIDSLIESNIEIAKQALKEDDLVDEIHRSMYKTISDCSQKQPELIEEFLQILSLSRYLERIADLTSNIAEDVIYLIDGEIIRHQDW